MLGRFSYLQLIYVCFYLLVILAVDHFSLLIDIDRGFYDFYQSSFSTQDIEDDIVIVAIDDASIEAIGRWPWSRSVHAKLIKQLKNARTIVFDVLFSERMSETAADNLLVDAVIQHGNVVFPVFIERSDSYGAVTESLPFADLFNAASGAGHVHIEHDDDSIVRSVYLKQGVGKPYWEHISLTALRAHDKNLMLLPGDVSVKPPTPYAIVKDYRNLIRFADLNSFPEISYIDVLKGELPSKYFDDKVVFVGATATGMGDSFATPVGDNLQMPGVTVNANIYRSLKHELFVWTAPLWLSLSVVIIVSLFIMLITPYLSGNALFGLSLLAIILFSLLQVLLLVTLSIWLMTSTLIFAVAVNYLFWTVFRLNKVVIFFRNEISNLEKGASIVSVEDKDPLLEKTLTFLQYMGYIKAWEVFDVLEGEYKNWWVHQVQLGGKDCILAIDWLEKAELDVVKIELFRFLALDNRAKPLLNPYLYDDPIQRYIDTIKNLQVNVEESQKLISRSISLLKDAVLIADFSGEILFKNDMFVSLLGNVKHLSQLFESIDASPLSWQYIYQTMQYDKKASQFELVDKRDSNIYYLLQGGSIDAENFGANLLLLSLTDITPVKIDQQRREQNLHYISHDLRSPVSSIVTLAESELQHDPSNEFAKRVHQYAQRNLEYANSFLDLSRAELVSEKDKSLVNLTDVMEQAKDNVILIAQKKGVNIVFDYADDSFFYVMGVAGILERALQNLLDNAIKHSQADDTIWVELLMHNDYVECLVTDEGLGLSEDDVNHIFQRFKKGSSNKAGAGLGLSFVALVAERHQGSITAVNVEEGSRDYKGTGAQFTLRLPAVDDIDH